MLSKFYHWLFPPANWFRGANSTSVLQFISGVAIIRWVVFEVRYWKSSMLEIRNKCQLLPVLFSSGRLRLLPPFKFRISVPELDQIDFHHWIFLAELIWRSNFTSFSQVPVFTSGVRQAALSPEPTCRSFASDVRSLIAIRSALHFRSLPVSNLPCWKRRFEQLLWSRTHLQSRDTSTTKWMWSIDDVDSGPR